MEKLRITIVMLLMAVASYGQTAKEVMDKAAATVSNKSGAQASFTIKGQSMNTSGTITVKGRKFHATTPQAIVWFDGKTQWTYVKKNDEVNVANPSESELQSINPYNFIYMYKNGYKMAMSKKTGNYEVHLTSNGKKSISEMYVVVNAKSYVPSQIRMKQAKGWTTINLTSFKKGNFSDGIFRFSTKDFPSAEVIDLR